MNQILYYLFIEWKPESVQSQWEFCHWRQWGQFLMMSETNIKNILVYLNLNHSLTTVFWRKDLLQKGKTDACLFHISQVLSFKWLKKEISCWLFYCCWMHYNLHASPSNAWNRSSHNHVSSMRVPVQPVWSYISRIIKATSQNKAHADERRANHSPAGIALQVPQVRLHLTTLTIMKEMYGDWAETAAINKYLQNILNFNSFEDWKALWLKRNVTCRRP